MNTGHLAAKALDETADLGTASTLTQPVREEALVSGLNMSSTFMHLDVLRGRFWIFFGSFFSFDGIMLAGLEWPSPLGSFGQQLDPLVLS